MRDHMPAMIHDEDGAAAHAGLFQTPQDAIERDTIASMAAELIVNLSEPLALAPDNRRHS